jgi:hypothetical protein
MMRALVLLAAILTEHADGQATTDSFTPAIAGGCISGHNQGGSCENQPRLATRARAAAPTLLLRQTCLTRLARCLPQTVTAATWTWNRASSCAWTTRSACRSTF